MTDAEGLTTTYTYEALGRTIAETRPGFCGALLVTSNEYNTANQLVATRAYALNEGATRFLCNTNEVGVRFMPHNQPVGGL